MSYCCCQSLAVGASGAFFGLVGSYAVYMWRHKRFFGNGKESLEHIARVVILNMGMGLLSRGIDNWVHLGGLLGSGSGYGMVPRFSLAISACSKGWNSGVQRQGAHSLTDKQ